MGLLNGMWPYTHFKGMWEGCFCLVFLVFFLEVICLQYVCIYMYYLLNMFIVYYLIYLTLHWPFLINLRLCSLSINSYEYSCHTIWAGLFTALFIWLMYGKVAQWLNFRAVNHGIMGSNPAETVYFLLFFCFHVFLLTHPFVDLFCIFSIFFYLF